jgi:hypothetical protein
MVKYRDVEMANRYEIHPSKKGLSISTAPGIMGLQQHNSSNQIG